MLIKWILFINYFIIKHMNIMDNMNNMNNMNTTNNMNNEYNLSNNNELKFKVYKNKQFKLNIQFYEKNIPNEPNEKFWYNIDNIDNDTWKKIRWYINKYDFIVKEPIINRAFYKYWEIVNEFNIFKEYQINNDVILHCAEAPGGFIQGSNIYLQIDKFNQSSQFNQFSNSITGINDKITHDDDGFTIVKKKSHVKKNDNYKIYTISLNKDLKQYKVFNLPSYNKNVINKHVCILNGKDHSGDINNLDNIDDIYNNTSKINNKLFYLITGDGGFDEGCNFNNKEQLHYHLILNEIYSCIKLQKQDGHFILKMFDIFTDTSIHLLYLLSLCYKEVYIYKPLTSRPTNSEKYIICKYFDCKDNDRDLFLKEIKKLSEMFLKNNCTTIYKSFTLFDKIPENFIFNICDINTKLLNRQCKYLKMAIDLCTTEFMKNYDKKYQQSINERKTIFKNWERYYNLNTYI